MTRTQLTKPEMIRAFIHGGKSIFTIVSKKTGRHMTYRVRANKDGDRFWVSSRSGDGEEKWSFFGVINLDAGRFFVARKSKLSKDALEVKAFDWFYKLRDYDQIEFYHEGMCCKCGRQLTDPVSIELGMGPKCRGER